ncbi:hypothetical protein M5X17_27845 [Paenibacillus alvei]|uniref:hypothetical protein n=1 Tax=Paenibacillus alvei TaxID=44250 RepID=UPI00227EC79F|nr:hypothetical protein [Paenibacillus alvei]MCY9737520.1 hypothetical protein [Paenibacillus alvei]
MSNDYSYEVDRVHVIVFVKNDDDIGKYLRLFRLMMGEQVINEMSSRDCARLETDNFTIRFYVGGEMSARGLKAHYVINMVQDQEWDNEYALPTTGTLYPYLKEDPKWSKLFNDEPKPYIAILHKGDDGWRFKSNETEYEWTSDDLETSLKSIEEEGWARLSGSEKRGIYSFKKERYNESI